MAQDTLSGGVRVTAVHTQGFSTATDVDTLTSVVCQQT